MRGVDVIEALTSELDKLDLFEEMCVREGACERGRGRVRVCAVDGKQRIDL